MKNNMTNTSPNRSFTRAVAGTTFCTIGTLTDIIELAEKMKALAKENPQPKAPVSLLRRLHQIRRRAADGRSDLRRRTLLQRLRADLH